jgi:hypothetical protein
MQDLHAIPQPVCKHEKVGTQRALIQPCLDLGVEAIETRPHIHRLQGQVTS